ncbi:type II toxin-antitoxin system RelE/ParE family toxin [Salinisphaera sp. T31B1]|uniref:type II toxin-antitoxin system RelE/ParE family toxin n=1 Tax=Salinisphaera sp. T31B1 TaxID=727963 RepID=UPI00333F971D
MPVKAVRLSPAAATDLRKIQQYTSERWGHEQWLRYSDEVDRLFEQLSENPELGRLRDEIRQGLRSVPMGSHVVWYRTQATNLDIVRILHAAMDPNMRL